ncbi:MAG: sigma 54-interacting transcriptional regulator [Firmicutes bacterium]|nr:sigma 54-interacting transcriptional regulator [Bacillota bacterium]
MLLSVSNEHIMNLCRSIFEDVADAIYVCDLNGRLLYMNNAAEKLDGFSFGEVRGRSVSDLYGIDPGMSPLLCSLSQNCMIKNPRYSYWINGREVVQSCVARPLVIDGNVVGAYSVQHDLTEIKQIVEENILLQQEAEHHRIRKRDIGSPLYDMSALIGESKVFAECRETAWKAAKNDSAVMLVGDTGSGKELFARAIHENSRRKDGPFLALNCAAIPEDLLEGILFGTAKGVYTGAVEREGLLLQAEGGTVFLDEMNSMPLASQAKLLRVLEEKKVYKLGAAKGKEINVRIISSSNELPQNAVERGALREDLFYRLSVVYLRIPSLSERKEDIPLLVDHFLKEYNRRFQKNVLGVAENVMSFFMEYPWAGNVRQLKHCIESAMNFTESGQWIGFSSLPPYLFDALMGDRNIEETAEPFVAAPSEPKPQPMETVASKEPSLMDEIYKEEKEALIAALREAKGNMAKAARILGINRQAVVYSVKKYGIK